jgi:hypothetical protein
MNMKRNLLTLTLLALPVICLPVPAQVAPPNPTPAQAAADAAAVDAAAKMVPITAVLMDANCQEIVSQRTVSSTGTTVSTNTTPSPAVDNGAAAHRDNRTDNMLGAGAGAGTATGAAPVVTQNTTKTTNTSTVHGSTSTRSASDRSGTTAVTQSTTRAEQSRARTTDTAVVPAPLTGNGTLANGGVGDTSNTNGIANDTAGADLVTVTEHYRTCQATPNTTAYAIYNNGKVMVVDDLSNQDIHQLMTADNTFKTGLVDASGSPKWMLVEVTGGLDGDHYKVISIKPRVK